MHVGACLGGGRRLCRFSLDCHHASLHPRYAISKPPTLNNTSLSVSLRSTLS